MTSSVPEDSSEGNLGQVEQRIESYRSATVNIGSATYNMVVEDDFGGDVGAGQGRSALNTSIWSFENLNVNFEQQAYTQRQCTDAAYSRSDKNAALEKWNTCIENGKLTLLTRKENLDCVVWQQCTAATDCTAYVAGQTTCSNGWCLNDRNNNGVVDVAECAPGAVGDTAPRNGTTYSSGRISSDEKLEVGFGYVEFRAKMPFADSGLGTNPPDGMWPAIWGLGAHAIRQNGTVADSTGWPMDGEIDVMEYTQILEGKTAPDNAMGFNALWRERAYNIAGNPLWQPQACSAWPNPAGNPRCNDGDATPNVVDGADIDYTHWHTWGFLRDQNSMKVYIRDDQGTFGCLPYQSGCNPKFTFDLSLNNGIGADEFKQPIYWIMNNAMGGELGCSGWKSRACTTSADCAGGVACTNNKCQEGPESCINVPWDANGYNAGASLQVDYFRVYKKANDTYTRPTSACETNNIITNCGFDQNSIGHRTDVFFNGADGQTDIVYDATKGAVEDVFVSTRGWQTGTPAAYQPWAVQARQEGFTLQTGKTYSFGVDMKVAQGSAMTVPIKIVQLLAPYTTITSTNCSVGTSWATCNGSNFSVPTTAKYKFEIDLGAIADNIRVQIDNMTVKDTAPASVCGNGVIEAGEECDDGNAVTEPFNCPYQNGGRPNCAPICDATCKKLVQPVRFCGDGVTQSDEGEQCDDANTVDTDACRDNCALPTCTDGVMNHGETAIDCGGPCNPCGGGTCSTGQTIPVITATATAASEGTYTAALAVDNSLTTRWGTIFESTCSTLCDNGEEFRVDFGKNAYVSSAELEWESASASAYSMERSTDGTNWTAVGSKSGLASTNHRIDTFSAINQVARYLRIKVTAKNLAYGLSLWDFRVKGDVDASCSASAGVCGDGIKNGSEACDDGNTTTESCAYNLRSCTVCSATCTSVAGAVSYCGDLTIDSENGEQCDDGNTVDTDSCSNTCKSRATSQACGNGKLENGEQCDDGNTVTEDCQAQSCTVCRADCTVGPGTVGAGATCADNTKLSAAAGVVASASSTQAGLSPNDARDGNTTTTRWASAVTGTASIDDDQYLQYNLGAPVHIRRVRLVWETAYSSRFQIETSLDGVTFKPVYAQAKTSTATDDFTIPDVTAQYVRMHGLGRGTIYGHSLWEMEVWGSTQAPGTSSSCVSNCTPACTGKTCGADGCGGVCGICATGQTCNGSNQCVATSSGTRYEAESASLTSCVGCITEGGGDSGNKVIMTTTGNQICWTSMNMAGKTKLTAHYGNGEPVGDTFEVWYGATKLGTSITIGNTAGWSSPAMVDGSTTFAAQSGSGQVCLKGVGSGWIASVDYVDVQ